MAGWTAKAQSTVGLTGQPDTSYSNFSAYNNIRKQHPHARLVPDSISENVWEERNLVYCQRQNRKMYLDAFSPVKKQKRRPAIVIIHGGGWRSGSRSQHHALAQRLAQLGYVCFTPEYRLSTEALYPAAVHDVKAALRWVRRHAKNYSIDENKIAVMGFSAGGQLAALAGATNNNEQFEGAGCFEKYSSAASAIIDLDGTLSFVHPESGEGDDSKKTSAATYWFGYSKAENKSIWEEASPLTHVGKHAPPTLFINSGVARMHAGRDDFIRVLKETNIYTEVKTFGEAPHHFPMFEPWFTPMVNYIDNFLKAVFNGQ
jgi:pectinesterase